MANAIQLCEGCKLPSDRAWKTYKDKDYGFVWDETGYCRHCWQSALEKMNKEIKHEETVIYRGAF